jgi:hypothetical protein
MVDLRRMPPRSAIPFGQYITSPPRHCHRESLFGANPVIDILGSGINIDLHLVDLSIELIFPRAIIWRDRLAHVAADLHRLVHREEQRICAPDDLPEFFSVHEERDEGALAAATTVVGEL